MNPQELRELLQTVRDQVKFEGALETDRSGADYLEGFKDGADALHAALLAALPE